MSPILLRQLSLCTQQTRNKHERLTSWRPQRFNHFKLFSLRKPIIFKMRLRRALVGKHLRRRRFKRLRKRQRPSTIRLVLIIISNSNNKRRLSITKHRHHLWSIPVAKSQEPRLTPQHKQAPQKIRALCKTKTGSSDPVFIYAKLGVDCDGHPRFETIYPKRRGQFVVDANHGSAAI